LVTKRLELLHELVPGAVRVAVLVDPAYPDSEAMVRDLAAAARAMGLQIQVFNATTSREINAAFVSLVRERPDALFVGGEPFLNSRRVQLVNLASRHAVPATYALRDSAEVGGLMSYGPNIADLRLILDGSLPTIAEQSGCVAGPPGRTPASARARRPCSRHRWVAA
jgi:putative tryptophan/tyrosine transport system substrate-binding protein